LRWAHLYFTCCRNFVFQELWGWLESLQYITNSGTSSRAKAASIWDMRRMSNTSSLGCQLAGMRRGLVSWIRVDR